MNKTEGTLQTQTDRRKSVCEKNTQRSDIDETMGEGGEGGGDEDEDGESEDDNEDDQGTGVTSKCPETKRRKQWNFYSGDQRHRPLMWWKQYQEEFPDIKRFPIYVS